MPAETLRRPDESIPEWCARRRINVTKFYKMQRQGIGPEVLRVPGTTSARITPKADAAWEKRIYALARTAEAKREQELKSAQRRAAVMVAVERGTHVTAKHHNARLAREAAERDQPKRGA